MTIEFQPDHNYPRIYRPKSSELLTLGQTGDMEWPIFVHARVHDADRLMLILTSFTFSEPNIDDLDPNIRVLSGEEINKYQRREFPSLFLDHELDQQVIKIMNRRFRWFSE